MGLLAIIAALVLDKRLADPDGFLGPSWLRLPLLLPGALLADLLPRTLWLSAAAAQAWRGIVEERLRTHWRRERLTLVVLGIVCFYVTYVSYRNLKSFLPFIREVKYDRELHIMDRALMFGHEPGNVMHDAARHRASRRTCCPTSTCGSCRWCRSRSRPGWCGRATCRTATGSSPARCWRGRLGTTSYYMLPTLGPGFYVAWVYKDVLTPAPRRRS